MTRHTVMGVTPDNVLVRQSTLGTVAIGPSAMKA